ncbi:spidroin-1-like [Gadus chalcogrammus]|uniref:spidroin-1-like n=1 Tax=Gadus chalcogrammus TaxID=1042646 RepID=UPI0024C4B291|nr:spidroin-1-like [Gadus chalcogrammus]
MCSGGGAGGVGGAGGAGQAAGGVGGGQGVVPGGVGPGSGGVNRGNYPGYALAGQKTKQQKAAKYAAMQAFLGSGGYRGAGCQGKYCGRRRK